MKDIVLCVRCCPDFTCYIMTPCICLEIHQSLFLFSNHLSFQYFKDAPVGVSAPPLTPKKVKSEAMNNKNRVYSKYHAKAKSNGLASGLPVDEAFFCFPSVATVGCSIHNDVHTCSTIVVACATA